MRLNQLVLHISKCPEEYSGSKHIEMPESGGSIGRNLGSSVHLIDHNRFISGTHCLISVYGDTYYLSDVSTNGTLINGNKILKNQPVSLYDGDSVVLGRYEITVVFEPLSSSLDIAADIAPERDTTDPLIGLGHEEVEEQESGRIEDLFIETQSDEVDSHDPIAHLNFTMQRDDDYLIQDEQPNEPVIEEPTIQRQIPDDSLSVHSEFDVPNLIPEDWMNADVGNSETESLDLTSVPHLDKQSAPIQKSEPINTIEETVVKPSFAQPKDKQSHPEYWEEVTQTLPLQQEVPEVRQESIAQMTVEPPTIPESQPSSHEPSSLAAFCRGLGISDSELVSGDEMFFQQMGACLRLCIDKLQKELCEVEDLKQVGDREVLATDLAELMLTLNQQQLLAPNELIEQMLDELDEHRVNYNQALNDALHTSLKAGDPLSFAKQLASESRFVTKGKLWSAYSQFYRDHHKELVDVSGATMQRKIKEQYNKNLKVKHA